MPALIKEEAPAATEPSPILQEPLGKLPEYLNNVFIQIGKAFRDAQQPGSKAAIQTRAGVPMNITENNNRFHEALDEIEMEIVKAKAVFERDLTALQARRAERERAAGAERLRAANLERTASQAAALSAAAAEVDTSALNDFSIATIAGSLEGLDTAMNLDPSVDPAAFENGISTERANGATADGTPSDTIRIDTATHANESGDVDFESMFNSAGAEGNDIDFDLVSFTAELNNSGNVHDDPFADLGTRMEFTKSGGLDFSKGADGEIGDSIEVMMPGLNNLVTTGSSTEATTTNVPATTSGPESAEVPKTDKSMEVDFGNLEDIGGDTGMDGNGESSFDQMFFDGSGEMGMDGDMDGEMADFNDDWFKNM